MWNVKICAFRNTKLFTVINNTGKLSFSCILEHATCSFVRTPLLAR